MSSVLLFVTFKQNQEPQEEYGPQVELKRVLEFVEYNHPDWQVVVQVPSSLSTEPLPEHVVRVDSRALPMGKEALKFESLVHYPACAGYPVKESELLLERLNSADLAAASRLKYGETIWHSKSLKMLKQLLCSGGFFKDRPQDSNSDFFAIKRRVLEQCTTAHALPDLRGCWQTVRKLGMMTANVGVMWKPMKVSA